MNMHWAVWAALAAMVVYLWTLVNVGKARKKFKVAPPLVDGPVEFLSVLRVQVNTVEQMVIFFPALFTCAMFLGDGWAGLGGGLWVIGRILYAHGYYQSPDRRSGGFLISFLSTIALMIGTVVGLLMHY